MDVSNTLMQIQKQRALYKGWPGDADTETLNTDTKDGRVMWIQKH